MLAVWIAVQLATSAFLKSRIRDGKKHVHSLAYVGATLDVAIPTTALYIMCSHDSPLTVLTSSVNYTYSWESSSRRFGWTCAYASSWSLRCQLLRRSSALVSRSDSGAVGRILGNADLSFFMRSVLLLVGGLAAGYVSFRLRHTLMETLSGVQEREQVLALFGSTCLRGRESTPRSADRRAIACP
jgi:hypothetical protein